MWNASGLTGTSFARIPYEVQTDVEDLVDTSETGAYPTLEKPNLGVVTKVLKAESITFEILLKQGRTAIETFTGLENRFTYGVHWFAVKDSLEVQVFLPIQRMGIEADEHIRATLTRVNLFLRGTPVFHFEPTPHEEKYTARIYQRRVLTALKRSPEDTVYNYLETIKEIGYSLVLVAHIITAETGDDATHHEAVGNHVLQ